MLHSEMRPQGSLGLTVYRNDRPRGRFARFGGTVTTKVTMRAFGREWLLPVWPVRMGRTFAMLSRTLWDGVPRPGLGREVNVYRARNLGNFLPGYLRFSVAAWAAFLVRVPFVCGSLRLERNGVDYGLVGLRVVTDTGVAYIVDAFQNSVEVENLKYHGFGTGTNAEAVGDTTLQTELTTEYATDNTRPTGTTTEGATGNIYRTVATLDPDAAVAITEHGVFHQAANSGGTLLDRTKFAAINLAASGDTLQATYELTFTSGS